MKQEQNTRTISNINRNDKIMKSNKQKEHKQVKQNIQYDQIDSSHYQDSQNHKKSNIIFKIVFIIQFIIILTIIIALYNYHTNENSKYLKMQKYYKQFTIQINKTYKSLIKMQSHIYRASQKLSKPLHTLQNNNINNNIQNIQQITVIFTCSGRRYKLFEQTLQSFFKHNTYPIYQIIAVDDGLDNIQFQRFIRKYRNITWISTNYKVGQLYAIDLAYSFIQTQYYFHSQQDFLYLQDGFIEKSLKIMKKYNKVSQVILSNMLNEYYSYEGEIKTDKTLFAAFSFNPSLKRMHQYRIFLQKYGGYMKFAKYKSFGQGAGNTQICISIYLQNLGYYGYKFSGKHVQHNGLGKGLNRFQYSNNQGCNFD